MAASPRHRLRSLLWELKRRRVFRVAAIYVVAAFAVLQAADILVPALHLPAWTMTLLVVLVLVGSPVVVALAWAFDIVPGGTERTPSTDEIDPRGEADSSRQTTDNRTAAVATARVARAPEPIAVIPATSSPRVPSVAVIPFLNLSADPENEYFADGITEDVIAHLSKIGALRVIARASVMPFKKRGHSLREIGEILDVTTVLDGSVRRAGERVRIVAELVAATSHDHLWGETYDRELTDIFAIQTDVALHIAAALKAELSPDERSRIRKEQTTSLEAYHLYLKGRHWFIRYSHDSLQRAIDYFNRAVAQDPGYALAYAAIAMAYAELTESGALPAERVRRQATDAAERALQLDPDLAEAHCAAAHLKCIWDFDWSGAEGQFRRALELSPGSADAYDFFGRMCGALERYDEAIALVKRAQQLDPLAHRMDVATTLLRAGRHAEAAEDALRALEFEAEYERAHATLGWAYFKQGRTDDGLAELRRAVELAPTDSQWLAQLGQALALAGRTEEARDILRRLEARPFVSPYHLAFVYTGLGEYDRAMDMLERAFMERGGAIYGVKGSFLLAPLRPHPRFKALLQKLNLADAPA